jgi:hypothetical protein
VGVKEREKIPVKRFGYGFEISELRFDDISNRKIQSIPVRNEINIFYYNLCGRTVVPNINLACRNLILHFC